MLPKWKHKLEDSICSLQILMSLSKVCKLDPHENEIWQFACQWVGIGTCSHGVIEGRIFWEIEGAGINSVNTRQQLTASVMCCGMSCGERSSRNGAQGSIYILRCAKQEHFFGAEVFPAGAACLFLSHKRHVQGWQEIGQYSASSRQADMCKAKKA